MHTYSKPKQKETAKDTVHKKDLPRNLTGISDEMKSQFENHSGLSFDSVRVHYNSDKPAHLQALAYTQGNQVYIGPGQEKHLGHELGHVVQQMQGNVKATQKIDGVSINNDKSLEAEADRFAQNFSSVNLNNSVSLNNEGTCQLKGKAKKTEKTEKTKGEIKEPWRLGHCNGTLDFYNNHYKDPMNNEDRAVVHGKRAEPVPTYNSIITDRAAFTGALYASNTSNWHKEGDSFVFNLASIPIQKTKIKTPHAPVTQRTYSDIPLIKAQNIMLDQGKFILPENYHAVISDNDLSVRLPDSLKKKKKGVKKRQWAANTVNSLVPAINAARRAEADAGVTSWVVSNIEEIGRTRLVGNETRAQIDAIPTITENIRVKVNESKGELFHLEKS